MLLNAKKSKVLKIFVKLNTFAITLVDEDTKKALTKTIEQYSTQKYPVKLRF